MGKSKLYTARRRSPVIAFSRLTMANLPFAKHPPRSVIQVLWRQQRCRESIRQSPPSTRTVPTSLLSLLLDLPDRLGVQRLRRPRASKGIFSRLVWSGHRRGLRVTFAKRTAGGKGSWSAIWKRSVRGSELALYNAEPPACFPVLAYLGVIVGITGKVDRRHGWPRLHLFPL